MAKRLPRILIVHNEPVLPRDHPDSLSEIDILETVAEVERVLPPAQYDVARLGYARDPRTLIRKVRAWKPHAVFNLFEGEADRTETEVYHAGVLEWLGVPFTGCPLAALSLGRDKVRTKFLLQGAGLPTAAFRVAEGPDDADWPHPWPAFVKPASQDASVGIDQGSVVETKTELQARVEYVLQKYGGPVLIEEYLPGRELHVNLIEDATTGQLIVLPPTEIRFEAGNGYWPIYSYEGKWNEQSVEYKSTPLDTGVILPDGFRQQVEEVCRAGYRAIGMRDYGRVDLRITPDGKPHILEVNPNPYLNSIGLVDGLKAVNRQFPDFVRGLVQRALDRTPPRERRSRQATTR